MTPDSKIRLMPNKKVLDKEISSFFLFRGQFWPAWIQKCHSIDMQETILTAKQSRLTSFTVLGIRIRMFLGLLDLDPSLFS
jgi:hypothetical protein